ncbi:MAG: tetratricopeptide repeat protein [Bacteroidales bacterium]|nr:tetratricopeptide repeat protein [Bacteroidales bacterium]
MKKQKTLKPVLLLILALLVTQCTQEVKEKTIPITTDSEAALELYQKAVETFEDVYIEKAIDLFDKALSEDPDFFMASFRLAAFNLYFYKNEERFNKYSEIALKSDAELSKGEELFKSMLERMKNEPESDFTDLAKQLVELYPEDDEAYYALAFANRIIKDYQGVVEAYKNALEVTDNQAPIYNMMGYAYLDLEQFDEARIAFDKYIELEPDLPNPYDSKGDYHMKVDEYGKAYESFLKAYEIDSLWSYKKAMKAKGLQDSLQVE